MRFYCTTIINPRFFIWDFCGVFSEYPIFMWVEFLTLWNSVRVEDAVIQPPLGRRPCPQTDWVVHKFTLSYHHHYVQVLLKSEIKHKSIAFSKHICLFVTKSLNLAWFTHSFRKIYSQDLRLQIFQWLKIQTPQTSLLSDASFHIPAANRTLWLQPQEPIKASRCW